MARPLRIEYPCALYHVTSRGNAGQKIFRSDKDRTYFLDLLGGICDRFHWLCYAYALMDNHYHLIIETPDGNLSRGMRQLNGMYTQRCNWKYRKTGHIFQGRYKAIIVDKDSYLLELCRYVALNPARAHMVEKPEDFRWSSFRATAGIDRAASFLALDWILAQFSSDRNRAQILYKAFVEEGITKESPWKELKGQIFLADTLFIEAVKTTLPEIPTEIPHFQRWAERPSLADIFGGEVQADRTSRNKAIHVAHVNHHYTLKEIAKHLDIHYATVSKAVKRAESEKKLQGKT